MFQGTVIADFIQVFIRKVRIPVVLNVLAERCDHDRRGIAGDRFVEESEIDDPMSLSSRAKSRDLLFVRLTPKA